ncbi:MAG: hypothetical protein SNH01_05220 [Rikenellaceae bacterium]
MDNHPNQDKINRSLEKISSHELFVRTPRYAELLRLLVDATLRGEALYFVSNHDMGTIATVEKFTNREFLREFFSTIPKGEHFNALFKVTGLGRTDSSCELTEIKIIE